MAARGYVVGIAGPVGAGKSTLVEGLAARIGDAAVLSFDRYERITEQPIERIRLWMQNGADLDEMEIPGLARDLQALKEGRAVADPLTGAPVPARQVILFETQFGRRHAATGRHIDLMVWIDTPLDLALARKVRQFTSELDPRDDKAARDFGPWLREYLGNYLDVVGGLLRIQRETVGAGADLVLDGQRDPQALQAEVEQAIRDRLG
jgi:thymidylate kinase